MKKIPMLFQRENGYAVDKVNPQCAWVFEFRSIPHQKWDGTCMKLDADGWWSRREVKSGKQIPDSFVLEEKDSNTGHLFGWMPYTESSFVKLADEALEYPPYSYTLLGFPREYEYGTYELIGPKINKNAENVKQHRLMPHKNSPIIADLSIYEPDELNFELLKNILLSLPIEGVVWYGDDGQRAKLRRKDFNESESKK